MAHWQFRTLNPNENSGVGTVEDNFANEERSSVEILVRETLQNPLDARGGHGVVEVRYSLVTLKRDESVVLKALFSDNCLQHFVAGKLIAENQIPEFVTFLVVEDFGTTGLEGSYDDSALDGPTQNWNAFWFREGEGAKPSKSNGGAGQGKITLYAASKIRSVLALTHRASDGLELAFGCCRFRRNYKIDGKQRWAKEARWGSTTDPEEQALPITDKAFIAQMKEELHLARGTHPGTSFLVPLPCDITLQALQRAVIDEFFVPIVRGRLQVNVGSLLIDSKSVCDLASADEEKARHPKHYRDFLRVAVASHLGDAVTAQVKLGWSSTSSLSSEHFDEQELEKLRDDFKKSKIVSVDFPVTVRKKDEAAKQASFRVVIKEYAEGDGSSELFMRQDLAIDGEKRLKGSKRIQPVLALTFIDDQVLSAFLVAAEEPTHRTWNASRPRVAMLYNAPGALMSSVRNAALKLVEFLTPEGTRDTTALAQFFSLPEDESAVGKVGGKNIPNPMPKPSPEIPVIPKSKLRPVQLILGDDGFRVAVVPKVIDDSKLPITCTVKVAYATTWGDPFALWDAADFWLNDQSSFPISHEGVIEIERDGNEIHFKISESNGYLDVSGFDVNRKLEVRLNYKEYQDADNIEND